MTPLDALLVHLLTYSDHTIMNYSNGWGCGSGMDGKRHSTTEEVLNEASAKGFLRVSDRWGWNNRQYFVTQEGYRYAACVKYDLIPRPLHSNEETVLVSLTPAMIDAEIREIAQQAKESDLKWGRILKRDW